MKTIKNDLKQLTGFKNVVIIHHNDMDGRSAAAIAAKGCAKYFSYALDKIKYIECNYKDEYDYYGMVDKDDLLIIVDYSIDPKILSKIIKDKVGNRVILLDHHESAYNKYKNFKDGYFGIIEFEDDKLRAKSGCELTYEYFDMKLLIDKRLISLIGEFDTWRHSVTGNKEAVYISYALGGHTVDQFLQLITPSLEQRISESIAIGKNIYEYNNKLYKEICETYSYETKLKGFEQYSCIALNSTSKGSMIFGDNIDKYDICIIYIHDGERYTYGIYSTKINVGKIATSFGGGGHPGAAGFTLDKNIL